MAVRIADKLQQYNDADYYLVDSSAVEYIDKNGNVMSVKQALENGVESKEDVERLLGLTKEEIEAMADLILDTEVRLDKTYSSSKIHSDIQDAIDSSKSFTLAEIGKMSGASYKVVTSTTEMTDEKIIYLLENGATYDMYIVETTGTVTKIGDTTIDLSSYLKVTDAESAYLKKTEATSTYVAQTSFNNHITDTVAHLTQLEKNKLLTTDNITSTINNSSDNTQVPTAKATYNLANTKADASHTHIISDITDLSIPRKISELTNDAGYISEVINTLTSADTDKPLSANQGKILNDTKLNKTDANKLNCVTIDNVSLKEYILTNFTGTEKTYYLIAKTTCTDLPKASNFYITVETPGLYTYKVTAKELNDSNGIYVCTYRTISSSWTEWRKVCTTTVADVAQTTITPVFPSGVVVASGGAGINYVVRNGWCNVNFVFNVASATTFLWTDIATGLPKPANSANIVLMSEGEKATQPIAIKINSTGSVSSRVPSAISTTDWWTGNISYPVAES